VIERGRGAVALSLKDWDGAIRALDAAVAANQLAPADQLQLVELLAKLNYQQKQYPAAANWTRRYKQLGGSDAAVFELLPQALYLTNDFAAAAAELEPVVAADEAAGRPVPEATLRLLASCYIQAKDDAGYVRALERMALAYPKPEYWTELTARATKQPGFSERLWLDVYRLRFAAGLLKQADEFADMAGMALQAGYPAEAMRVIDKGYALGLLGNGKEAAAHAQLRERTEKAAEKDSTDMAGSERSAKAAREGDALVNLGFAYVAAGNVARGLPLMEAGIAKGNLRRIDDARLHHGIALWMAGKRDEAARAFGEVKGADGSAALARVWSLFARSPAGRS
jgi:tetratricopeptide (TPR) repeat protein